MSCEVYRCGPNIAAGELTAEEAERLQRMERPQAEDESAS